MSDTKAIKFLKELNETGEAFQQELAKVMTPVYNFEEETADAPQAGCQCDECQYWDAYAVKHGLNATQLKIEASKAGK